MLNYEQKNLLNKLDIALHVLKHSSTEDEKTFNKQIVSNILHDCDTLKIPFKEQNNILSQYY